MPVNSIYSLEYFNYLGLAHADKNKNGDIDDNEKSIFATFMKQFDMNNNGELENEDVELYYQSVELTESEKQAESDFYDFFKERGITPGMDETEEKEAMKKFTESDYEELEKIQSRMRNDKKRMAMFTDAMLNVDAANYLRDLNNDIRCKVKLKFNFLNKKE